eukprot:1141515-Pelagomonas_calceolata.AAC.4
MTDDDWKQKLNLPAKDTRTRTEAWARSAPEGLEFARPVLRPPPPDFPPLGFVRERRCHGDEGQ